MVQGEVGELRKVSDMPPKDRCPDGHPELQCNFDGTNNDAVAKHDEKVRRARSPTWRGFWPTIPQKLASASTKQETNGDSRTKRMNIGLLGGTFDPIHLGHIALARAATEKFNLHRVLFVPANVPPHKQKQPVSDFFRSVHDGCPGYDGRQDIFPIADRGTGDDTDIRQASKGKDAAEPARPNYTIETVRGLKQTLRKADQVFFVMGIDAFLDIGKWYEATALLRECEFVVASRPGYSLADVANALPEKIRPASHVTKPFQKQAAVGDLVLPGATIRLLDSVQQKVSSSAIREAVASGKALGKLVNPAVAEYIRKMGLYGKR